MQAYSPGTILYTHLQDTVDSIFRYDSTGIVQSIRLFKEGFEGSDYSKRPDIGYILEHHQKYTGSIKDAPKHISKVFIADSGEKAVSVCIPVFENAEFAGILSAVVSLEKINDIVGGIKVGQYGYAQIIDDSGTMLAHPKPEYIGENIIIKKKKAFPNYDWTELKEIVSRMTEGKEEVGSYHSVWWNDDDPQIVRKLTAFAPIRLGNDLWSIGVVMGYDEVSSPIITYMQNTGIAAGLLILVFAGAGVWFYKVQKEKIKLTVETEEVIEESEKKLSQIIQGSAIAIFVINNKHVVTHWNKACENLTGISADEVVGTQKQWSAFYPIERAVMADLVINEHLEKKIAATYSGKYHKSTIADGAYEAEDFFPKLGENGKWLLFTAVPVKDIEGKTIGAVETLQDITGHKRVEETLRKSEERFRQVAESTEEWIWEVDSTTLYTYASPVVEKLLGYKPEEIVGKKHSYDLFHPDDIEPLKKAALKLFAEKKPLFRFLNRNVHKDGRIVWLLTSGLPILDENGNLCGYRGADTDITERKQAEKEKEQLQSQLFQTQKMEAIGTLAGGIAHDFNNILAALMGYIELSLDDLPEGTQLHDNMEQSMICCNRAKDMVRQILTFSRKTEAEIKPMKVAPVIKEALKMLRSSIPTTIEIAENIEFDSGTIMADPTQVHQLLVNLCTNASHAIGDNAGLLKVGLTTVDVESPIVTNFGTLPPGAYVKLAVQDSGCGMDRKTLERIFEPFFTTKDIGKGTGLGLSVVHGIIESYGGLITVESTPGKGTTFSIFFPRIESSELEQPKPVETISGGEESILLVDDEESIIGMMTQMLQRLGYTVEGFTSPGEALKVFQAEPGRFDLVITNYAMPTMTGKELAGYIMNIRGDIPIILCTGFSENIDAEKARIAGIKEFVMKPVTKDKIAVIIRKVLDKKETAV